ncbi:RPS1 [Scenedesmus sp. PABB004]|nr:RPS1 [Scenedesmus sp. PABB004]
MRLTAASAPGASARQQRRAAPAAPRAAAAPTAAPPLRRQTPAAPPAELADAAPPAPGDTVVGRVISTGPHGSRVELAGGRVGYLPRCLSPLALDATGAYAWGPPDAEQQGLLHLQREFTVQRCDDARGPLLSAAHADWAMVYRRAAQLSELCADGLAVLTARVVGRNAGGLRAVCAGAVGFIPKSYLPRTARAAFHRQARAAPGAAPGASRPARRARRGGTCGGLTRAARRARAVQADDELLGMELPVLIEEVVPEQRRIVLNSVAALHSRLAAVAPATLVRGTVTQVKASHAWVALEGLDQDGLWAYLHRDHLSVDQSFPHLQAVLSPGEAVTAMVLRAEEGGSRIALSTAHLEAAPGDMLRDRAAVFAGAARHVALVRRQMSQADLHFNVAVTVPPPAADAPAPAPAAPAAAPAAAPRAAPSWLLRGAAAAQELEPAFALSGYMPGRGLGVVMAAALWPSPAGGGWAGGAAAAALSSLEEHAAEQGWWAEGPLAWRAADEREQWAAELAAAPAAAEAPRSAPSDAAVDGEQQWLQPPPPAAWEDDAP